MEKRTFDVHQRKTSSDPLFSRSSLFPASSFGSGLDCLSIDSHGLMLTEDLGVDRVTQGCVNTTVGI